MWLSVTLHYPVRYDPNRDTKWGIDNAVSGRGVPDAQLSLRTFLWGLRFWLYLIQRVCNQILELSGSLSTSIELSYLWSFSSQHVHGDPWSQSRKGGWRSSGELPRFKSTWSLVVHQRKKENRIRLVFLYVESESGGWNSGTSRTWDVKRRLLHLVFIAKRQRAEEQSE